MVTGILLEARHSDDGYVSNGFYTIPVEGTSEPEFIVGDKATYHTQSQYSPDGTMVYFTRGDGEIAAYGKGSVDIVFPADGEGWHIIQDWR